MSRKGFYKMGQFEDEVLYGICSQECTNMVADAVMGKEKCLGCVIVALKEEIAALRKDRNNLDTILKRWESADIDGPIRELQTENGKFRDLMDTAASMLENAEHWSPTTMEDCAEDLRGALKGKFRC